MGGTMWYNIESFIRSNHVFHISYGVTVYRSKKREEGKEGGRKEIKKKS